MDAAETIFSHDDIEFIATRQERSVLEGGVVLEAIECTAVASKVVAAPSPASSVLTGFLLLRRVPAVQ